MSKIILYHGTPNKIVTPKFGGGDEKHDYGKGFYLTESIELAKEWAVCRPNDANGWVHKYELGNRWIENPRFSAVSVLSWLAELMKHRDAAVRNATACLRRNLSRNLVWIQVDMM